MRQSFRQEAEIYNKLHNRLLLSVNRPPAGGPYVFVTFYLARLAAYGATVKSASYRRHYAIQITVNSGIIFTKY